MVIEQAWLLKGFVLAHNAPAAIVEAVEAVLAELTQGTQKITGRNEPIRVTLPLEGDRAPEVGDEEEQHKQEPSDTQPAVAAESTGAAPKKKRNFSPEARAAAGERMRAYQARKKAEKQGIAPPSAEAALKPFTTVPVEKLISDHAGYAGRRDPNQALLDSDWPDIKNMLNVKRMSVSQVASDYDVSFDTLRSFVDTHEAREGQSLGEARALPQGGA